MKYNISINEEMEIEAGNEQEAVEKFMEWFNNLSWADIETRVEKLEEN